MSSLSILIFNGALYVFLLVMSIIKKRGILGIIMTSFYAILAIGCAIYYHDGAYWNIHLMLWPFIYLFIIYFIFSRPFHKKNDILNKLSIPNISLINKFFDVYLIISVLYIISLLGAVVQSIQSGSWMQIYFSMRGEDALLYSSFYQRFLINVTSYLSTPAVFYAFYSFAKNIDYRRKGILLIMPLITTFMWAIYTASRSSFLGTAIIYLISYLVCSGKISSKFKRYFIIIVSVFGSLSIFFIIAVNVSRFGEGNNEWASSYFGHSYIVGHNILAYTDRLGYGSNFFGWLYDIFHINVPHYHCHVDNGVAFHPLIAMRYSDFGLFGTIVYASLVCLLCNTILKKRKMYLGELYVILYFYISLFKGALYDNANILHWIIVIVVSTLLTVISKIQTKL